MKEENEIFDEQVDYDILNEIKERIIMLSKFYDHVANYFDIASTKHVKSHIINTFLDDKSNINTPI